MREIKFKGKRLDNGEWVYGYLIKSVNERTYISFYATEDAINIPPNQELAFRYHEVDPKTVCQFTGLHDKNDKDIYEGDIIKCKYLKWLIEPINSEERDGGRFGLCASANGDGVCLFVDRSILGGEIIGSIYDNPELLEVG